MGAVARWLKQTALWIMVPALGVAAAVGAVVSAYEPLVFDPSLYEVQLADAAELETIDAEAIEESNAVDEEPVDVEVAQVPPQGDDGALADGTWTGYAACGTGNAQGWKPYYVGVTVVVSGGEVARVADIFGSSTGEDADPELAWDADENQRYLDWAIDGRDADRGVREQISAERVASDVDVVSGATYSSVAVYNAYASALAKSAEAGGAQAPVSAAPAQVKADAAAGAGSSRAGGRTAAAAVAKVAAGTLADGTWTGYDACGTGNAQGWKPYYVGVTLTVKAGKVISVDKVFGSSKGAAGSAKLAWDEAENGVYLDNARYGIVMQLEDAIAAGKKPASVDTVSGATFSSNSIFAAYYEALRMSAAAAGSTIDDPGADTSGKSGKTGKTGKAGKTGTSGKTGKTGKAGKGGVSGKGGTSGKTGKTGKTGATGKTGKDATTGTPAAGGASGKGATSGAPTSGTGGTPAAGGSGASDGSKASDAASGGKKAGGGNSGTGASDGGSGAKKGSHYGFALCDGTGLGWSSYYVFVEVEASGGSVKSIVRAYGDDEGIVDPASVYSPTENAMYLNWALEGKFGGFGYRMKSVVKQIQEKIDAGEDASGVQTVSGATRSSRAIKQAYQMAVENAAAGVGGTPAEAVREAARRQGSGAGDADEGARAGAGGGAKSGESRGSALASGTIALASGKLILP